MDLLHDFFYFLSHHSLAFSSHHIPAKHRCANFPLKRISTDLHAGHIVCVMHIVFCDNATERRKRRQNVQVHYCKFNNLARSRNKYARTLTSTISTSSVVFLVLGFFSLSFLSRIARLDINVTQFGHHHGPSESTDLSLSSLMVVITTLLGLMPMGAVAPLDLSRCTRST